MLFSVCHLPWVTVWYINMVPLGSKRLIKGMMSAATRGLRGLWLLTDFEGCPGLSPYCNGDMCDMVFHDSNGTHNVMGGK